MKTKLQLQAEKAKELRPMNIGIRNPSAPNPAKWRDEFKCETEFVLDKDKMKGGI